MNEASASAGRIWADITVHKTLHDLCRLRVCAFVPHHSDAILPGARCSTRLGNNAWDCLFSQEGFCARSMLGMLPYPFGCADLVRKGDMSHQVYHHYECNPYYV